MTTPSTYKLGYPPLKYSTVPCISLQIDPTSSDVMHPTVGGYYTIPTIWVNRSTQKAWVLTGISGSTATWSAITNTASGNVVGPSSATDNALSRFDGTTGKLIQNSTTTLSDTSVMTFPAQGGVVLTAGGTNPRKGTFTLTAGASGDITTTAAVTGCVIAISITSLGTVTSAKPMLITITNGTKFTITSSDATDTSSGTWAIVG